MGYYSDVVIAVGFPDEASLVATLAKYKISEAPMPGEELAYYRIVKYAGYNNDKTVQVLYAKFNNVKWYPDYKDVQCHMNFLRSMDEQGFATAYLRSGEDNKDIEVVFEDGDYDDAAHALYDMFGVETRLVCPDDGVTIGEWKPEGENNNGGNNETEQLSVRPAG